MQMPLLIQGEFNAPLSLIIIREYNKLVMMISKIPKATCETRVIDFTGGKASCSEVIAYQIGWGKRIISWYTEGINGELVTMPGEGFTSWDYVGLATHFYTKYHYDGSQNQMRVFYETVLQILTLVEKEYQTGDLDKTGVWPWCTLGSGKKWPLSKWIKINTAAPYKRASALVKAAF